MRYHFSLYRGSVLTDEQDARVKAGLVAALPDLRMEQLFEHRPDLVRDCERLLVASGDGDEVLGVLGARDEHARRAPEGGRDFLHVIVQMIAPSARRTPLFVDMWGAFMHTLAADAGTPSAVALKTYNPIAFAAMRAFSTLDGVEMYPRLEPGPSLDVDALAVPIADSLAPGKPFDARLGVIKGIGVPRDLYRARPECRDERIDQHFARVLEPGDRLLCVLLMPTAQARARVLEALPQPDAVARA